MSQRTIDLTLAVLASIVAFFLSWPYHRATDYWAESTVAWVIYFVVGFVLAVYIFYAFLRSLRLMAVHEAPGGHDDGGHGA